MKMSIKNSLTSVRVAAVLAAAVLGGTALAQMAGPSTLPAAAPTTLPAVDLTLHPGVPAVDNTHVTIATAYTTSATQPSTGPATHPVAARPPTTTPATATAGMQPNNGNNNNGGFGRRGGFGTTQQNNGNGGRGGRNGNGRNNDSGGGGGNNSVNEAPVAGATGRAGPMGRDYDVLLNRTIFSRTRTVSQPRENGGGNGGGGGNNFPPVVSIPRPERNMVFNGTAIGSTSSAALIEDTSAGKVLWLKVGDLVARGHVKAIGFNELDYEGADGKIVKVQVGQTLDGGEPPPVSSRSLGISEPTQAASTPGGIPALQSPANAVLERLRLARLRESGGVGATLPSTTPPGPGGPGSPNPGPGANPGGGGPPTAPQGGPGGPNGPGAQGSPYPGEFNGGDGPIIIEVPVPVPPQPGGGGGR